MRVDKFVFAPVDERSGPNDRNRIKWKEDKIFE